MDVSNFADKTLTSLVVKNSVTWQVTDDPSDWDNQYILSRAILGNGSVPLKVEEVLEACRDDNAHIYTVFKLDTILDVPAKLTADQVQYCLLVTQNHDYT